MKIITWNVNGIRAVHKKGEIIKFIAKEKPDILCLQEIKSSRENIPADFFNLRDYLFYVNSALRPGYSGVAVLTKEKPINVESEIGFKQFDQEGRVLKLDFAKFTLLNFYIPNGGRQKENLDYKLDCYDFLLDYLRKAKNRRLILAGDFNVAHTEIDLARPKENQNNIMFTPPERERISKLIKIGFVDTFRKFHSEGGNYTWWLYFANARARNIGWRIDYIFASKPMMPKIKDAFILPKVMGSDHCPTGIEMKL